MTKLKIQHKKMATNSKELTKKWYKNYQIAIKEIYLNIHFL